MVLSNFFSVIPRKILFLLSKLVGIFFYYILRSDRRIAIKNLTRIFGAREENKTIAKKVFQNAAFNLMDYMGSCRKGRLDEILNKTDLSGLENIKPLYSDKKGIIVITAHKDLDTARKALNLGAYDFLSKPISDRKMIIRRSSLIKASIKAFQKVSPSKNILHIKENIKNLISHKGMSEIRSLEDYIVKNFQVERTLFAKGYLNSRKFTIVAVPTLIEKNPTQLVGLGDTISSLSFIEDLIID